MLKSLFFGVLLIAAFIASPANAISYLEEIERAKNTRFENELIIAEDFDIGVTKGGINKFKFTITNKQNVEKFLMLQIQGSPGLNDGEISVSLTTLPLQPNARLEIDTNYKIDFITPFSRIYLYIYDPENNDQILFKTSFHIGADNPEATFWPNNMAIKYSEHMAVFYFPNSFAETNLEKILKERENGLQRINDMIGLSYTDGIIFYLFPDMETKHKNTLHQGEGWAFNYIIAEVYNDAIQLDPFHEMSHIVTGTLGTPPPLFDEGFAVYAAEIQGADALLWLGWPGQQVDDVVRQLKDEGRLIPLSDLIAVTNIGDSEERAIVEYPESASFVKFLVEAYGAETFREIFSTLKNSDDPETVAANLAAFEAITCKSLGDLEAEWLEGL